MSGRQVDLPNPTRFPGGLGVALNKRGEPDPYYKSVVEKVGITEAQSLGIVVKGQIQSVMVQVDTAEATATAKTLNVRVGTTVVANGVSVAATGLVGSEVATANAVEGDLNVQLAGADFAELDGYVIVSWIQVDTRSES